MYMLYFNGENNLTVRNEYAVDIRLIVPSGKKQTTYIQTSYTHSHAHAHGLKFKINTQLLPSRMYTAFACICAYV